MFSYSSKCFPPLVMAASIMASGCSGGASAVSPPITLITKTSTSSGDSQQGPVRQLLPDPLRVRVTEGGVPSSGTTVSWSTTARGASVDPAAATTDADGVASTSWTLGTVSGSQSAYATLSDATGSPVLFTATAAPDAAASFSKLSGDNQTGEIGTQLGAPLQAKVSDQFGNGVPGVGVTWVTTSGTLSATTVPTDGSGASAVNLMLDGIAGPITITATATGLMGSPLAFTATASAAAPVPMQAAVRVSNILFSSNRNGTMNPAVDTVAVGGTVTWTWTNTGMTSHSVMSTGSPSFPSSGIMTGDGQSYAFTFSTAGTYQYTCAVHTGLMTGRIVVR